MVDFKWPERIPVLITQLRSNPDQLEQFLKCEVGEIPVSLLVHGLNYPKI